MKSLFALQHDHLIVDACCVINLFESGHIEAIVAAVRQRVAVASYVLEVELKRVDIRPLIEAGHIEIVSLENEAEEIMSVNFAVSLDDGEATTGAIATHRHWSMATDETKAITFFTKRTPPLTIVTTAELVKHWAETDAPPLDVLRDALRNIRTKARYEPGVKHSLRAWWLSHTT